jgi:hypothetical protein
MKNDPCFPPAPPPAALASCPVENTPCCLACRPKIPSTSCYLWNNPEAILRWQVAGELHLGVSTFHWVIVIRAKDPRATGYQPKFAFGGPSMCLGFVQKCIRGPSRKPSFAPGCMKIEAHAGMHMVHMHGPPAGQHMRVAWMALQLLCTCSRPWLSGAMPAVAAWRDAVCSVRSGIGP